MKNTSFDELKAIMDPINSGVKLARSVFHNQIIDLLASHGIRIRTDDGHSPEITVSYPKSLPGGIIIGLRYIKNNGTKTEDLFVFEQDQPIQVHYKGRLQKIFPEYAGSHKLQR